MPVIITSKRDGFRRCGIEHPAKPVEYPDDRFTEEQLKKLKAEPMLIVQVVDGQNQKEQKQEKPGEQEKFIEGNLDPEQLETMKMDDLRQLAGEMQLEVPSKITKKELVELISSEKVLVDEKAVIEPNDIKTE
jgi:hypothetical protein